MEKKRYYEVWEVGQEVEKIGYKVTVRSPDRNTAKLAFMNVLGGLISVQYVNIRARLLNQDTENWTEDESENGNFWRDNGLNAWVKNDN